MKVTIFSGYACPERGAIVNRMMSLASFLIKSGNSVTIVAPNKNRFEDTISRGIPIRRGSSIFDFLRIAKEEKPDIILSTVPPGFTGLDGLLVSKIIRVPLIIDVRDPIALGYLAVSKRFYAKFVYHCFWLLEKILYCGANKISVVTEFLINYIAKEFSIDNDKMILAPNGTIPEIYYFDREGREKIRKKLKIKKHQPVLGYYGISSKEPHKFLTFLGKEIIEKYDIFFIFLIITDEEGRIYLKNVDETIKGLSLQNRIFIDDVKEEKAREYLSACDIGLNPVPKSLNYQMPIKTYDYLACGLPLACYAFDGPLGDFVRKYDVGFVESNPKKFALKFLDALNNLEKFKEKGINGMKIVREYYNRKKCNKIFLREMKLLAGEINVD